MNCFYFIVHRLNRVCIHGGNETMSTAAPTKQQTTGYQFAKPQGICHITQQPIVPGQKFMAALRETPAGFERLDVSLDAWPQFDQKDVIGFWQTVMPKGETEEKRSLSMIRCFAKYSSASPRPPSQRS